MAATTGVQSSSDLSNNPPPIGECQCGCGKKTRLAPRTSRRNGWVKGEPLRYRRGHNPRKRLRYVVAPTGYKTDCWMWQLAKNSQGYGVVGIAPGKTAFAHRVYYEERFGPIPDGSELHHLCVVPGCVNPDHLVPTTRRDHLRISGRLK